MPAALISQHVFHLAIRPDEQGRIHRRHRITPVQVFREDANLRGQDLKPTSPNRLSVPGQDEIVVKHRCCLRWWNKFRITNQRNRSYVNTERLIFHRPNCRRDYGGWRELKMAMKDFCRLIGLAGERKPLSWAVDWFKQIGCDDGLNPVDVTLFSHWWMDHRILASKVVDSCCPMAFTEEETKPSTAT